MKIKYFQFKLINWSILYLGNVPRTNIASETMVIVLINNTNTYIL